MSTPIGYMNQLPDYPGVTLQVRSAAPWPLTDPDTGADLASPAQWVIAAERDGYAATINVIEAVFYDRWALTMCVDHLVERVLAGEAGVTGTTP